MMENTRINTVKELNQLYNGKTWSITYFEALGMFIANASVVVKEDGKYTLREEVNYIYSSNGH